MVTHSELGNQSLMPCRICKGLSKKEKCRMGTTHHLNVHQEIAELEKAEWQMGRCGELP
jgi:hypothetical protein